MENENKPSTKKVGVMAWVALILLICILSGAFRTNPSALKILDFTNLCGSFGKVGSSGATFLGTGGSGVREGFMQGLNLIPPIMFFCGMIAVFEQMGAFEAAEKVFRPLLRPILGIPGTAGIPFISSFTSSDIGAVMTRDMYENKQLTDDERTVFVAYQYAGSACINNTITTGAPLIAICPVPLGAIIIVEVICKLIGANVVRMVLKAKARKQTAKEAA